jgi:hypothetical protein
MAATQEGRQTPDIFCQRFEVSAIAQSGEIWRTLMVGTLGKLIQMLMLVLATVDICV